MARKPKDDTKSPQTAASISEVIRRLQVIVGQLEAQRVLMESPPAVETINSPWTTSLVDGMYFLQNWSDGVRDAVNEEKLKLLGVSAGGHQSANGVKIGQKSTKKDRK